MKNVISFIFLLTLLVSGCSQEEMSKNGTSSTSEGRVFTTSFEQNDSRTYVEDGHLSRWTEGDRISIFDASTLNCQYLFAGDTGDSGGTFFMLSKPEGTGTALGTNYAVYPYSENVKMTEDGVISVTLPSEQHYAENSYGLGDNIMVAVTENADDTFLKFKNVGGCLKLQLYGDDVTVKSITLMGNDGELISGNATITAAYDGNPVVTMADDATTSITFDCDEKGVKIGSSAEKATAFWLVVPPTTFKKGITIVVKDINNNVFTQTTDKQLAIERNVVKPMVAIKVELGNLLEDEDLEYQLLNYEKDGVDAIVTKEGLFAIIKQIPESTDYVFVYGSLYEENKNYVLINEAGFYEAIGLDENDIAPILYTSKSLLFLNSTGGIMYEFPYSKLKENELPYMALDTRATYTRSRVFRILELLYSVDGLIKKPIKEMVLKLLRKINEGVAHRYGGMVSDLIDLCFDIKDITTWLGMLDRMEEICFFGNAKVTALEAIKEKVCTFKIPCKIEGLNPDPDFTKALYDGMSTIKVLEHSYTLTMLATCDEQLSSESYTKETEIFSNGVINFDFTFRKLRALYSYEPSLILNLKYESQISKEAYERSARLVPNAPGWTPNPQIFHKSCTIYGDENSLVTGMVSSSVEKVQNVTMTGADVICSFSDVPSGAECQVVITQEGSEVSYIFGGEPEIAEQEVNVSGLTPSTNYVASSRIVYDGIPYPGSKSVSFSTPGPSGQIISVDDIKSSSAVVKCKFTNVGSGVECGIIITNNEGYNQKQTVSNTEEEQSVTISGLDPFTEYTCTPYVKLAKVEGGVYYKEGNSITFKTDNEEFSIEIISADISLVCPSGNFDGNTSLRHEGFVKVKLKGDYSHVYKVCIVVYGESDHVPSYRERFYTSLTELEEGFYFNWNGLELFKYDYDKYTVSSVLKELRIEVNGSRDGIASKELEPIVYQSGPPSFAPGEVRYLLTSERGEWMYDVDVKNEFWLGTKDKGRFEGEFNIKTNCNGQSEVTVYHPSYSTGWGSRSDFINVGFWYSDEYLGRYEYYNTEFIITYKYPNGMSLTFPSLRFSGRADTGLKMTGIKMED